MIKALASKIVILVTHQIEFLHTTNLILVSQKFSSSPSLLHLYHVSKDVVEFIEFFGCIY